MSSVYRVVRAAGGTAGVRRGAALVADLPAATAVVLVSDGDRPGRAAVTKLHADPHHAGRACYSAVLIGGDLDELLRGAAGADLADRHGERAAILEYDGALDRPAATAPRPGADIGDTDPEGSMTEPKIRAALTDLIDAMRLIADPNTPQSEREDTQGKLPMLKRAVRAAMKLHTDPNPVTPLPADPLDDLPTLTAAQEEPDLQGLLEQLPPTDADVLRAVLRAADENAEADDGDHSTASYEVERVARVAKCAEREAMLAVMYGERGDPKDNLSKPLTDAHARIKATDAVRRKVDRVRHGQARRATPATEIVGNRPTRLLSLADHGGALLSVGGVLVLAGEGGVAKTPLAQSVALGVAAQSLPFGALHGGLFDGVGGPVLIASYEDCPAVTADRLRKLADTWPADATSALDRVHVLEMSGRPLFGPAARSDGDAGFYNARPEPLAGWDDLWNEAGRILARLIVVDPALSAFVGQSNDAAPVREFLTALAGEAADHGAGVLLIAQSNKAARAERKTEYDPFDPGHVGGSGHWTDTARGAMSLTYDRREGAAPGARILAVSKANYGPARRWCKVVSYTAHGGEIVGFGADGDWKPERDWHAKPKGDGDKVTGKIDPAERAALDAL